jgi:hypothetical protein
VWTADGMGLDAIYFITNIRNDQVMLKPAGVNVQDLRRYKSSMVADDIMELIAYSLSKAGANQVRTGGLHPAAFGNLPGFRFDLSYVNSNGLIMKGTVVAAQPGGVLDAVMFVAPKEYYYGHYLPTFNAIVASIKVNKAG